MKAIQDYKGFKTKSAFAGYLDIKANVLSNWFSRDSFDEELLLEKIPELNRVWLLTGEGSMLKEEVTHITQNNTNGDNIQGNNVSINQSQTDKLLELLKAKDEHLKKSQEQIDKLISLIEKSKI